jgi:amino acid adenylation domain-containing protein
MSGNPAISERRRKLLEDYLQNLERNSAGPVVIPRRREKAKACLSMAQRQVWLHSQLAPDLGVYNEPLVVSCRGALHQSALERALNEIVRRHEAWRTTFGLVDGAPIQLIHAEMKIPLPSVDLSSLPEPERERQAQLLGNEVSRKLFDLRNGPLLRALLVHLDSTTHRLYLTFHHLIFDGVSAYQVFLPELLAQYDAALVGTPADLPELPIQFADFAEWQAGRTSREFIQLQMDYWSRQLAGNLPPIQLPADRPRPPVQTFRGSMEPVRISAALNQKLHVLSRREGATPFMTLLAAFNVLLYRYTGQEDLIVGTVVSGRKRSECERMLGCFQNPLPLRTCLSGNPPFLEVLRRVKETTLAALSHDDIPFEYLVTELHPERDPSRNPIFQILFSLVPAVPKHSSEWDLTQMDIDTGASKFDLYLELDDREEALTGRMIYSSDLFDPATIRRMIGHLEVLLEGIAANPEQELGALPVLTREEHARILVGWNSTRRDYPSTMSVSQLFEAQVIRAGERTAIIAGSQSLTYSELNGRSNQLASFIRARGVGQGALVGVAMERSPEMIVALLAILKAGGAYLPLDPDYPDQRLRFMVNDARAGLLLADEQTVSKLPSGLGDAICVDRDWPAISRMSNENLPPLAAPGDLAYVTYTSGSTGEPKAVEIPHRAVVRLLFCQDYAHFSQDEVFLQLAPLSFDASTFEIWGTLLHGGRCVLFPGRVPVTAELGSLLRREQVSTVWLTASLFNSVVDEDPEALSGVSQLLIGGEALSPSHVARAFKALPSTRIINGYGPSENTTFTCCYSIPRFTQEIPEAIPIGKPIANTQVYLLDSHRNLVPVGVNGELYIGGDGLARGYLNRPELTAERFVSDSFSGCAGDRLYRTGDLAHYQPDGNIIFSGRADDQVKIRGYRIELGEVEAAIAQFKDVQRACVALREDTPGVKRLVVYYVPLGHAPLAPGVLRSWLRERLPEYMVPATYVAMSELTLTTSGKVDRRKLPAPEDLQDQFAGEVVTPRNDLEARLVKIWESVLGRQHISVHDSFFDLGGHSLLAVKLLHVVEREFGRKLPLSVMLQAQTVALMSQVLDRGEQTSRWTSLVPIEPHGSRAPFFCIHGIGGTLLRFHDLARSLGPDQPVYGLQALGLDGSRPPLDRIEDMAAHYIGEMRSLQRKGPYYLGGLSFGGIVAFEMAQQLLGAGEQVGLLALFDTYPGRVESRSELLLKFLELPWRRKIEYLAHKARIIWDNLGGKIRNLALPRPLRDVQKACRRAAFRYDPQVYPGRVTLFRATQRALRGVDDPQAGWTKWAAGGLEIYEVEGDHVRIIAEPYVRTLALQLKQCLKDAQSGRGLSFSPAGKSSAALALDDPSESTAAATWTAEDGEPRILQAHSDGSASSLVLGGPALSESPVESFAQQVSFWRPRLAGLPPRLELATELPRTESRAWNSGRTDFSFLPALSESLKDLASAEGVSLRTVLLAGFMVLIARYTGRDDILIGWPHLLPSKEHANGSRGNVLTSIALRASMVLSKPFRELLSRVEESADAALLNGSAIFDHLMAELYPGRDLLEDPVFSVYFSFVGAADAPSGCLSAERLAALQPDVCLQLDEDAAGVRGTIVFHGGLFSSATMERFIGHYQTLLNGVVQNPDGPASSLPLLSSSEVEELREWNSASVAIPSGMCVFHLIEEQAAQRPDAIAVAFGEVQLTYAGLVKCSNRLANFLRRRGVGPDVPVGISLDSSLELAIALVGAQKAGGACLPLDPKYPVERLAYMVRDSGTPVILTQRQFLSVYANLGVEVVCMDDETLDAIEQESSEAPEPGVGPDNLAYIIYTSGSTGKPKGVLLTHRNYVNHHIVTAQAYQMMPGDRTPQFSSISFDAAVEEIFATWAGGGTLVMRTPDVSLDVVTFRQWLERERVTVFGMPTAYWQEFVYELSEMHLPLPPSLRLVVIGGEKASASAYETWLKLAQGRVRLVNSYGPTEASIIATMFSPDPATARPLREVPIGKPLPNYRTYILDANLQPVPVGVPGELLIGGIGVASGYLNQPELTAERFIPDTFSAASGARMYRTGDVCRFLPDGNLEFRGRVDNQVKIRSFRVELGEVESILGAHPRLRDVAVLAHELIPGEKRLIAYYVASEEPAPAPGELGAYLKERLPEYMVPSVFIKLDAMPLTPNGKVDRRALPVPNLSQVAPDEDYLAPRNEIEARLVKVWEGVLGMRPIGVRQSFFDLGGHSLLAVRLMGRIDKEFRKKMPLTTLLQAPTIEKLAGLLSREGWTPAWSSLVPIHPYGSKPPFFVVHGVGGAVIGFWDLAKNLGPDQPVYGLQAQGLDGKFPPLTRVEDMAASYVREIRTLQPSGPYYLGGLSFGGAVALEMARQFQEQGDETGLLVLFDTFPGKEKTRAELMTKLLSLPLRQQAAYIARKLAWNVKNMSRRVERMGLPVGIKAVQRANHIASANYQPPVYDGRVTLFRPEEWSLRSEEDSSAGWSEWARGGLTVYDVPGGHITMLMEPHVKQVARVLNDCLERARSNPRHLERVQQ